MTESSLSTPSLSHCVRMPSTLASPPNTWPWQNHMTCQYQTSANQTSEYCSNKCWPFCHCWKQHKSEPIGLVVKYIVQVYQNNVYHSRLLEINHCVTQRLKLGLSDLNLHKYHFSSSAIQPDSFKKQGKGILKLKYVIFHSFIPTHLFSQLRSLSTWCKIPCT